MVRTCARARCATVALQWPHLFVFIHPRHGEMDKQLSQEYLHSPGADVHESRRRRGRVPEQMCASPDADVGKMWGVHVRIRHIPSELADRVNPRVQRLIQHTPIRKTHQYDMGPGGEPPEQTVR